MLQGISDCAVVKFASPQGYNPVFYNPGLWDSMNNNFAIVGGNTWNTRLRDHPTTPGHTAIWQYEEPLGFNTGGPRDGHNVYFYSMYRSQISPGMNLTAPTFKPLDTFIYSLNAFKDNKYYRMSNKSAVSIASTFYASDHYNEVAQSDTIFIAGAEVSGASGWVSSTSCSIINLWSLNKSGLNGDVRRHSNYNLGMAFDSHSCLSNGEAVIIGSGFGGKYGYYHDNVTVLGTQDASSYTVIVGSKNPSAPSNAYVKIVRNTQQSTWMFQSDVPVTVGQSVVGWPQIPLAVQQSSAVTRTSFSGTLGAPTSGAFIFKIGRYASHQNMTFCVLGGRCGFAFRVNAAGDFTNESWLTDHIKFTSGTTCHISTSSGIFRNRTDFAMCENKNGTMFIAGGIDVETGQYLDDVWTINLNTTLPSPLRVSDIQSLFTKTAYTLPNKIAGAKMVMSPITGSDEMILIGGHRISGSSYLQSEDLVTNTINHAGWSVSPTQSLGTRLLHHLRGHNAVTIASPVGDTFGTGKTPGYLYNYDSRNVVIIGGKGHNTNQTNSSFLTAKQMNVEYLLPVSSSYIWQPPAFVSSSGQLRYRFFKGGVYGYGITGSQFDCEYDAGKTNKYFAKLRIENNPAAGLTASSMPLVTSITAYNYGSTNSTVELYNRVYNTNVSSSTGGNFAIVTPLSGGQCIDLYVPRDEIHSGTYIRIVPLTGSNIDIPIDYAGPAAPYNLVSPAAITGIDPNTIWITQSSYSPVLIQLSGTFMEHLYTASFYTGINSSPYLAATTFSSSMLTSASYSASFYTPSLTASWRNPSPPYQEVYVRQNTGHIISVRGNYTDPNTLQQRSNDEIVLRDWGNGRSGQQVIWVTPNVGILMHQDDAADNVAFRLPLTESNRWDGRIYESKTGFNVNDLSSYPGSGPFQGWVLPDEGDPKFSPGFDRPFRGGHYSDDSSAYEAIRFSCTKTPAAITAASFPLLKQAITSSAGFSIEFWYKSMPGTRTYVRYPPPPNWQWFNANRGDFSGIQYLSNQGGSAPTGWGLNWNNPNSTAGNGVLLSIGGYNDTSYFAGGDSIWLNPANNTYHSLIDNVAYQTQYDSYNCLLRLEFVENMPHITWDYGWSGTPGNSAVRPSVGRLKSNVMLPIREGVWRYVCINFSNSTLTTLNGNLGYWDRNRFQIYTAHVNQDDSALDAALGSSQAQEKLEGTYNSLAGSGQYYPPGVGIGGVITNSSCTNSKLQFGPLRDVAIQDLTICKGTRSITQMKRAFLRGKAIYF